jgi:hypothetical protein
MFAPAGTGRGPTAPRPMVTVTGDDITCTPFAPTVTAVNV